MKKIIIAITSILLVVNLGCKNKTTEESPTSVVEAMAKESEKLDVALIIPFLCADDKAAIEKANTILSVAAGVAGKSASVLLKEILTRTEIINFKESKFTNEKINGDIATVQINSKVAKERIIKLKKENDQWKVYLGLKDVVNKELTKLNFANKILPGIKKMKEGIKDNKQMNNEH